MKENQSRINLLRSERVSAALLKLGLPTMAGMLISAMYNVVDAWFVGGLGTSQMGAVSVVFPIVQIIIGLGMTFGAGAASYISRLLGAEEYEQADRTASTALFSGLIVGGAVIVMILCFLDPVLKALGATETILPYARTYAAIYIAGSIINVMNVMMNNLLTAQGAAKFTMAAMVAGSLVNLILDPIFIYVLGLGVAGAAAATVLSYCVNLSMYLWFLFRGKGILSLSLRRVTLNGTIYGEILKIGVPVLAFQLLTGASMGMTNTVAGRYGDYAVAAMGVVSRIMTIGIYVVFGFMKGFQPFAGYNYGAGQVGRLKEAVRLCLTGSTAFCGAAAVLCIAFAEPLVGLFGSDPAMIRLGSRALRASALLFTTFGLQMVYASLFLSIGKSLKGSVLSLGRQGIFFFPLVLVLPRLFGLNGLIWVQPAADLLSAVTALCFAVKGVAMKTEADRAGRTLLPKERRGMALTCSLTGILLNLLLFLLKAAAGLISHSVSITADAFNNLADAASSLLTMAGFYVAGYGAGKRHPFGHGRFEWIMGMAVSCSVIVMGAEFIRTAAGAIASGTVSETKPWMLLVLAFAILVKGFLFLYNRNTGKKIESTVLEAAAGDCLGDAVSTAAVLLSAVTAGLTGWKIDGWCALAVSAVMIWGGVRTFLETLEKMMGTKTDGRIRREIEAVLVRDPVVKGFFDLRIHDYGLGNYMASVRIFGRKEEAAALVLRAEAISHEVFCMSGCQCVVQTELEADDEMVSSVLAAVRRLLDGENVKLGEYHVVDGGMHIIVRAEVICSITMQKNEEEIGRKLECLVEEMAPGWRTELTFSIENDHLRVWRLRRLGRRKGKPSSFNRL